MKKTPCTRLLQNTEKILHLTTSVRTEGVIGVELLDESGGHLCVVVVSAKAHSRLGQPNYQVFVVPLQSVGKSESPKVLKSSTSPHRVELLSHTVLEALVRCHVAILSSAVDKDRIDWGN